MPHPNMRTTRPRRVRERLAALAATILMAAPGCQGPVVNGWASFAIEGEVRTAEAAPAPGLGVEARVWEGECGGDALYQILTTSTSFAGFYRVEVTTPAGAFSGCVRVTAGQASVERELDDVGADAVVRIDLQLP